MFIYCLCQFVQITVICLQRQIRPLLDVHSPDHFTNGNYHGSGSPNREYQQNFNANRRPQSNMAQTHASPGPTSQAHRQTKGYGNQSNQQYFHRNQNDHSSQGYGTQVQNRPRHGQQQAINQNYDLRTQRNFMQQGDPNNYPSSPTSGQHQPQYRNPFYNGMPQVYFIPSRPVINDGVARGFVNSPLFNIPANVAPSIPVFVNTGIALNHLYRPSLTEFATSPSTVSLQNNGVPVCTPVPVSVCEQQPVAYGQETGIQHEINSEQESHVEKNYSIGQHPEVSFCVALS